MGNTNRLKIKLVEEYKMSSDREIKPGEKIYRVSLKRRKRNIIDRTFQYRVISLVLFTILGTLIFYVILLLLYFRFFNPEKLNEIRDILSYLLIDNLFLMIVMSAIGIGYTNRIAGPIFRVKSDIGRVLDGENNVRVNFRGKDYFADLSESVNLLIERYYEIKNRG